MFTFFLSAGQNLENTGMSALAPVKRKKNNLKLNYCDFLNYFSRQCFLLTSVQTDMHAPVYMSGMDEPLSAVLRN